MDTTHSKFRTALATALLWLLTVSPIHAEEQPFKLTMQGLLKNCQAIVEGIMREDYGQIANSAEAIAFHQGPSPSKRMAIFNELGIEAMSFTMFDDSLRSKASKVKKAAEAKDQKEVINQFAEMMQGCANCHNSYRKRLRTLD